MSRSIEPASRKESAGLDVVSRLEHEWAALQTPLRFRLLAWARHEPVLARFGSPIELIRFLRSRDQWAEKDAALAALIRLARVEPLAARVMLEAVFPGLKRLAERVILNARDRDEWWQLLLAHAWEQIRTYPLGRPPSRIAANLLLETRRAALRAFATERAPRAVDRGDPLLPDATAAKGGDVEALLARAVSAHAISSEEAELILRTRIDGVSVAAVAGEVGAPYMTVYMRRHRAERRLAFFLGQRPVKNAGRKAHCSCARAAGAGTAGSAGGGPISHNP